MTDLSYLKNLRRDQLIKLQENLNADYQYNLQQIDEYQEENAVIQAKRIRIRDILEMEGVNSEH